MRKTELTPEQVKETANLIVKAMTEEKGRFEVIIKGGSGMGYQYKVRVWYAGSIGVDVMHLTYWLAFCIGKNLTDQGFIRANGIGYSRAGEAVDDVVEAVKRLTGVSLIIPNSLIEQTF